MVVQLLLMSAALGMSTFGVGMIPLSYAFSKRHLEYLSSVGTGLLLGAALGVIIPEGVEATVEASPKDAELPTGRIAFCLVAGFTLMLVVEQLLSPGAHSHSLDGLPTPATGVRAADGPSEIEFDAELGDLDHEGRSSKNNGIRPPAITLTSDSGPGREKAFPLLLGLVIHGSADGLALGVANLVKSTSGTTNAISIVVFLALILHKAPTSLAFTTSILLTNLPRAECKKYVVIFSSSTPLAAIASYMLFSFFGQDDNGNLIGMALLISGGTFLYVATVLQPVSNHSPAPGDMQPAFRVFLISVGIFIPLLLSSLFGHGH